MNSALHNLAGPGKSLSIEPPDTREIDGLLRSGKARLRTLGMGAGVWRVLDKCHRQRNIAEYEGHLDVTERLVLDLIEACDAVRSALASHQ